MSRELYPGGRTPVFPDRTPGDLNATCPSPTSHLRGCTVKKPVPILAILAHRHGGSSARRDARRAPHGPRANRECSLEWAGRMRLHRRRDPRATACLACSPLSSGAGAGDALRKEEVHSTLLQPSDERCSGRPALLGRQRGVDKKAYLDSAARRPHH